MTNFYHSFLGVGHEFYVHDFPSNPTILFRFAINQIPFFKFLLRNIFYLCVVIVNKISQRNTKLIRNNFIGLFQVELLQSHLLLNRRKVANNIISINLTNYKRFVFTFNKLTYFKFVLFLNNKKIYESGSQFHFKSIFFQIQRF